MKREEQKEKWTVTNEKKESGMEVKIEECEKGE